MIRFAFVVSSVLAVAASARAEPPSLPPEDARPGATRAQAIEAFVGDCHATLMATAWVDGEEQQVAECQALDVEQNCNPDIFGCANAFDGCQVACQAPCGRCQDACASSCDGCKAACKAGDKACVRRCAEARADCRGGCLAALGQCQGPACAQSAQQCWAEKLPKLQACDRAACEDYAECVMTQDDYEKAHVACAKKGKKLDEFCRDVCGSYGGMAFDMVPDPATLEPVVDDAAALVAACTPEAGCPADYKALVPFLGGFCAGALDTASLAALERHVKTGAIGKATLALVFNAYGAMYGYQFKKETWMNGFFYGPGGAWLPAACRARVKSVASAQLMPFRLTKLRDTVKRLWNEAP